MRKTGIGPVSIFRIYYKVLSKYRDSPFSLRLAYKTKKINSLYEEHISKFLENHKDTTFKGSLIEIEKYFEFCFSKDYSIFFFNLHDYIDEWKKNKVVDTHDELKYLFADKVIKYLKERNLTFKQYIEKKKNWVPIILQHYLATKEIPFEVILYLKVLDRCDIDKKKLKVLLHKEFIEMEQHKTRLKKLSTIFEGEVKRLL